MPRLALPAVVPLFALVAASAQQVPDAERFAKWEKNIVAIEKRLAEKPPAANPVVFAGSSTVVRWDLEKSFPGRDYVNVGFGGSQVRDATHFAHRLIGRLKPATVVFYSGDNDVAGGRSPEQVRDDTKAFVVAVREDAPDARVVVIGIKPSVKRWEQFATQTRANALVKGLCAADPKLAYVDLVPAMLGPGGGPPAADLFVADGLHLSPKGYEIATAAVSKALTERP